MFTLLKGPWCTWSGPAGDPGALYGHYIPPGAQLEDRWRCRTSQNINKFKQILQTVVVKFCRRLQRQKKWESPPVGAENLPIHVPFRVPVMSFEVKYAVFFEEKLIFCGSVPFQSQGPVIFNHGLGPKRKFCRFLTLKRLQQPKNWCYLLLVDGVKSAIGTLQP